MKLFGIFAIVALAMISGASAQPGVVVLSNMGADGLTAPGPGPGSALNTSSTRYAAGFKTGTAIFSLSGFAAYLEKSNVEASSVSFAVYSDSSGSPGSMIGSATPVNTVGSLGAVRFNFSAAISLVVGTKYWAVLESSTADVTWRNTTNLVDPSVRNSSGFTFEGFKRSENFNSSKTWIGSDQPHLGFSVFGTTGGGEVPEPALTSLLCLGGVALIRRRMKN